MMRDARSPGIFGKDHELPFRLRDIAIASTALIATAPVVAVAAAAIKADSPGPVFFKQPRVGRHGKPFQIYKLRSMTVSNAAAGIASDSDPRITTVGRFLRKWKIDELPQLFNVLRGEMSLVGPRPELSRYVDEWPAEQKSIALSLRPGVTDTASLYFRNEDQLLAQEEDPHSFYLRSIMPKKLDMNVEYALSRSFRGDLRILASTAVKVLFGARGEKPERVNAQNDSRNIAPGEDRTVIFSTTTCPGSKSLYRGQLAWMSSRGWIPILVSTPDEHARELAAREQVELRGIPMRREISPLADLVALRRWVSLLREQRPYAVNVGTPKAGLLGSLAAWITRVPKRIYTVRGLRLESESGLRLALLWLAEWLTSAVSTDVIAVSPSLRNELVQRRLVRRDKVQVIGKGSSNGVDADAVAACAQATDPLETRRALGIRDDSFVAAFVGRLGPDKGIDTLLDAAELVGDRNVEWLLVGRSEDQAAARRVEEAGPAVHWINWSDNVWGLLASADVLVLPTLREGFPNVVLEAAAAGVPAVVTRATGAIDSVIHNETGILIDVGDARQLADSVVALARDRELASRLGKAARRYVNEYFAQEPIWKGVEAVLDGVHSPTASGAD